MIVRLVNINKNVQPGTVREKTCKKCGETKPVQKFPKNWNYADSYGATCKECVKLQTKQRNEKKKSENIISHF